MVILKGVKKMSLLSDNQLNILFENYVIEKEKEKKIKDVVKQLNDEIKGYFLQNGFDKIDTDDYKASVSKSEKVSWVEPVLINKLKKLGFNELIKTKEYVDFDLLESYIYNKQLKETSIKDCKNITEVITLRVNKK